MHRGSTSALLVAVSGFLLLAAIGQALEEDETCAAGEQCFKPAASDEDERGWPDEDDAMHMDLDELRAEYKIYHRRIKERFQSGEFNEDEYKRKRKRLRKHFNSLLENIGDTKGFPGFGRKAKSDSQPVKQGAEESKNIDPTPVETSVSLEADISSTCPIEHGVDFPCNDRACMSVDFTYLRSIQSAEACCNECKLDSRCVYWTWAGPTRVPEVQRYVCWLKTGGAKDLRTFVGTQTALVSGYVPARATPTVRVLSQTVSNKPSSSDNTNKPEIKSNSKTPDDDPKPSFSSSDSPVDNKKPPSTTTNNKKSVKTNNKSSASAQKKGKELETRAEEHMHAGRLDESLRLFADAAKLLPASGSVHFRHAIALERAGRRDETISSYQRAIESDDPRLPTNEMAMAYNNLGLQLHNARRHAAAEDAYRASVKLAEEAKMTQFHYPYKNLGRLFEKNGRAADAIPYFDKAAAMLKDDALRLYSALLLPYVYEDQADMAAWRKRFVGNVKAMAKKGLRIPRPEDTEGVPQYYLSYHGKNDSKINARAARLVRAAAPEVEYRAPHVAGYVPPPPRGAGRRPLRVGFFSYYLRAHSVSKMLAGLLRELGDATAAGGGNDRRFQTPCVFS